MVRVCPKRDAVCPHGIGCKFTIDRYQCADETNPMTDPTPHTTTGPVEAGAGSKIAPFDPDKAMVQAGLAVDFSNDDERATVINIWHAMLAAAPTPPVVGVEELGRLGEAAEAHARRIYGLYNYSGYPGDAPPHQLRLHDGCRSQTLLATNDADEARRAYERTIYQHVGETILSRLPVAAGGGEVCRWLVERHLSSGSTCWDTCEHERQAREVAKECEPRYAKVVVSPLYRAPPALQSDLDAAREGEARLRAACAGIADDYMTSETHHPGYVLIPTAKFEAIRALSQPVTQGEG